MQWPALRDIHVSASMNSSSVMVPARTSSANFQASVPEPISLPRNLPFSIGPPVIINVGISTLDAPINIPGVVLSQPERSTTPSIGLARINSSVSSARRLRYNIVVGRIVTSPSDIAANSNGNPPISHTPRLTDSATRRRCALHGVNSDHVVPMPITGRPSITSGANPWLRIHER